MRRAVIFGWIESRDDVAFIVLFCSSSVKASVITLVGEYFGHGGTDPVDSIIVIRLNIDL